MPLFIEQARERVEELLFEAAALLNKRYPFPRKAGRRRLPPGDQVAMAAIRSHHNKSYRAFVPEVARHFREGKIAFAPIRQTLQGYASEPQTMAYQLETFGMFAQVFAHSTTEVIIDSSGVSPFFVANWRDHAAAVSAGKAVNDYRPKTEWFKMHIIIDRHSKAIIGFIITPDHGDGVGDATNFEPVLRYVASLGFEAIHHVIADNIYLTAHNVSVARELGFELVGPLKKRNFTSKNVVTKGLEHVYEYQQKNKDLTSELKRARSVVEVIFWSIKRESPRLEAIGTKIERERKRDILEEQDKIRRVIAERGGEVTELEAKRLESLANESAWSGIYISRFNLIVIRILRQTVRRLVVYERKMNRRISLLKGHYFAKYPEYSPVEEKYDDPWVDVTDIPEADSE